jgi:hypothetical protein
VEVAIAGITGCVAAHETLAPFPSRTFLWAASGRDRALLWAPVSTDSVIATSPTVGATSAPPLHPDAAIVSYRDRGCPDKFFGLSRSMRPTPRENRFL